MTTVGHQTTRAVRRRHVYAGQAIFAGAATVAALALFSAAPHGAPSPLGPRQPHAAASAGVTGNVIAVDDDGQTEGDTFTQNAQDQSTA